MNVLQPPGSMPGQQKPASPQPGSPQGPRSQPGSAVANIPRKETEPPKCFGTDYFGKWNTTGMTFESMKVDKPDYQHKCANCYLYERCYMANHIRILRIKR